MGTRTTCVILLLALLIRLGVLAASTPYIPPKASDPGDYERLALGIQHGHFPGRPAGLPGPTSYRPPLYPAFLGGTYRLSPIDNQRTWARIVQAGVGTIGVWLVGTVALQLFRRRRLAYLAMVIAAVWPPMWLLGAALLSEVLVVPLILGAVSAALRWRETGAGRWIVGAGVLCGLATLTRANAGALMLPLIIAAWSSSRSGGTRGFGLRSTLAPIALIIAFTLTVVPWTVRNVVQLHQLVPVSTEDGYTMAGTYNEVALRAKKFPAAWVAWYQVKDNLRVVAAVPNTEADWNQALRRRAVSFAASHPGYVLKVGWWNLRRVFDAAGIDWMRFEFGAYGLPAAFATIELISFWALIPLVLLGVAQSATRALPRWLWLIPLALLLPVFITGYLRFRAPIDPFIVVIAASGALATWDRLCARNVAGFARRAGCHGPQSPPRPESRSPRYE